MISLSAAPEEIAVIFNKLFEDLQIGDIRLENDNKVSFVLKINKDYITDISIQMGLSCDSSSGKLLLQSPQINSYTEDDGFWDSIKRIGKKIILDSAFSLAEFIFKILPGTITWNIFEFEEFGTVSLSLRNLAEAKKKNGGNPILWSLLARVRFQFVSVQNNQLFLQADLNNK